MTAFLQRTLGRPPVQLGLGIGSQSIRGLLLMRKRVIWHYEEQAPTGSAWVQADVLQAIENVLAETRRIRKARPMLHVAVGPSLVQTRFVAGVPTVKRQADVAMTLREQASKYFLGGGSTPIIGAIRILETGVWASAIDAGFAAALRECFARCGYPKVSVVPTVEVLRHGFAANEGESTCGWADGDIRACAHYDSDGTLVQLRVMHAGTDAASTIPTAALRIAPQLAALGEKGSRFADALAATLHDIEAAHIPLGNLRPQKGSMRQLLLGGTAALVTGTLVLAASGLGARMAAHRAGERMAAIRSQYAPALTISEQLAAVTQQLGQLRHFADSSRSVTLLLSALNQAFPSTTSIVSLRLDANGGTLTALAPHGADVLEQLSSVRGITDPQLSGAVMPEQSQATVGSAGNNESHMERVVVQFKWRDAGRTIDLGRTAVGEH